MDSGPSMKNVSCLPELVNEREAYARYGHILEDKELRVARVNGTIGFFKFKNKIHYRVDDLHAFIAAKLQRSYKPPRCVEPERRAVAPTVEAPIIPGMTDELMTAAANLLRKSVSKPPRSRSRSMFPDKVGGRERL